jgi:hypothetical protein
MYGFRVIVQERRYSVIAGENVSAVVQWCGRTDGKWDSGKP